MTKKTVFFTGGAGFIGLHVVPMLLERGYGVRIFDNMFRGDRDAIAELAATGDVELIDQDVRYGGAVHQAMKGCSPSSTSRPCRSTRASRTRTSPWTST